jgi:hypothetical protein
MLPRMLKMLSITADMKEARFQIAICCNLWNFSQSHYPIVAVYLVSNILSTFHFIFVKLDSIATHSSGRIYISFYDGCAGWSNIWSVMRMILHDRGMPTVQCNEESLYGGRVFSFDHCL